MSYFLLSVSGLFIMLLIFSTLNVFYFRLLAGLHIKHYLYNNIFSFLQFREAIVYWNYLDYPLFVMFGVLFLISSFISLLFFNYLGLNGIYFLNLVIISCTWLSYIPYVYYILQYNGCYYINFGNWMYLNSNYKLYFDLYIDNISISFSFLTLTIAVFVYNFAFSYLRYEPLTDRFIVLLNMFVISMMFLVSAGNLVGIFLGWELIGLTSFLLINFWVTRVGTLKAAFKAYSFNKISDMFFLFGIFIIFNLYYTLDLVTILNQTPFLFFKKISCLIFDVSYNDLICMCFIGCAFIKSAQFGPHVWLPDSMEAPVPASALIHSATLVSAGVFLLLRFNVFFEYSLIAIFILSVVGAITAFYGGFVSMFQADTKRVLAYSTISHCGFLMVLISLNIVEYTLLYLAIHGFFKAAVFMCIGNVNHLSKNNQDYKQMGLYYKFLPLDCLFTFIGLFNLAGLPFSLGFYIKHLLFLGFQFHLILFYLVVINCIFGALAGLCYSYRLFYNVFFDVKKSHLSLYSLYNNSALKSMYYSNTTLISNFAIIGLFTVTYILGFYYLQLYLNSLYFFSDTGTSLLIMNSYLFYLSNNFLLYNFSLINWLVFFIASYLCFSYWRTNFYNFLVSYYYYYLLCALIIFIFL